MAKIHALYKGENLLADGTIQEISEKTGKKINHLRFLARPAYKRRCKPNGKAMQMISLEEEE